MKSFNPCFNGFMDKDILHCHLFWWHALVSTLVLMDSWIKTGVNMASLTAMLCFNPCFNGFMDKDSK